MENGSLIGALAIFTIGAALVIAIGYFGYFLMNPRNRESAHRALVRDDKSASTEEREKVGASSQGKGTMKERLDHSEASSHPDDPALVRPAS